VDGRPDLVIRRLVILGALFLTARWVVLEIAVRLERRRPLRSAEDSPRAPGWMPLRSE
jgi:hypothetical protein